MKRRRHRLLTGRCKCMLDIARPNRKRGLVKDVNRNGKGSIVHQSHRYHRFHIGRWQHVARGQRNRKRTQGVDLQAGRWWKRRRKRRWDVGWFAFLVPQTDAIRLLVILMSGCNPITGQVVVQGCLHGVVTNVHKRLVVEVIEKLRGMFIVVQVDFGKGKTIIGVFRASCIHLNGFANLQRMQNVAQFGFDFCQGWHVRRKINLRQINLDFSV